jgi:FemAB-related protein (PEP-CTERM system-associated)
MNARAESELQQLIAEPTVATATNADNDAWQAFVVEHRDGTVFHSWVWRDILAKTFRFKPHYLIARRGTRVVGVLPLMEVKTLLFGHSLVSLPFCSWAGPIAEDEGSLRALDQAAVKLATQLNVGHMEYRGVQPFPFERAGKDLYVCFSKIISADHEVNLKAIPRKQRAMVRKGIDKQLKASIEIVETFYPLYLDNVHRHGTPGVPMQFFRSMAQAFGKDCEIMVIRSESGKAVSGVLTLYWKNEVFPFYAGDTPAARDLAANDFKYWAVMRRGVERGAEVFNYGRSKKGTGSYSFKRNWGFEPTELSYNYWMKSGGDIPNHNPSNPKYKILINSWRKLPRRIVSIAGPVIVKGLG